MNGIGKGISDLVIYQPPSAVPVHSRPPFNPFARPSSLLSISPHLMSSPPRRSSDIDIERNRGSLPAKDGRDALPPSAATQVRSISYILYPQTIVCLFEIARRSDQCNQTSA